MNDCQKKCAFMGRDPQSDGMRNKMDQRDHGGEKKTEEKDTQKPEFPSTKGFSEQNTLWARRCIGFEFVEALGMFAYLSRITLEEET